MAKYVSRGTTVELSVDGGTNWINLDCQISSFSGPTGSKTEIETTTLCSTASEYLGGLPDYGSISMTGFYDPQDEGVKAVQTLWDSGDTAQFQITWTDTPATVSSFSGYISEFSQSAGIGEALGMTIGVRLSGPVTVTPGA